MNDKDYIKAAVELADGWDDNGLYTPFDGWRDCGDDRFNLSQPEIDALAMQLVRQVDALSPHFNIHHIKWTEGKLDERTELHGLSSPIMSFTELLTRVDGPDRTMNIIKAVVDSGVLK